ncbi:hypothetical protein hamaS1_02140 [Moorella sp. Hama-1]|nr:hypothetical protein [Moorella sp. (in: firmicutes)]BCV20145.1 hypothetical protein hamaS1_02140 [Moorella sp. Hama-1]
MRGLSKLAAPVSLKLAPVPSTLAQVYIFVVRGADASPYGYGDENRTGDVDVC